MEKTSGINLTKQRLISIDALRGFTMFWIIGGDKIMRSLPKISDNSFFKFLDIQLRHSTEQVYRESTYVGLTFYDIIFPLFLFIIGLSSYFSYQSRIDKGASKKSIYGHILTRAAVLFAFGLFYYGADDPNLKWLGYYGVLQLLAFGYLFASLIMVNTSLRGTIIWTGGILLFYFLIMKFVPVPGYGAGVFTSEGNLSTYIKELVSLHIGEKWRTLLSPYMIPTVSTALLGVIAGYWMKQNTEPMKKVWGLVIAGMALLSSGLLVSIWFPVIKGLWSCSYVLINGGISALLLALFYWIIDVQGFKKWSFFFVVIGMNALTIYMLSHLIKFRNVASMISLGFIEYAGGASDLVIALITTALHWLLLYWLYKQKIFIKI